MAKKTKKKAGEKLDFATMDDLKHNPFAALGSQFGVKATPTDTHQDPTVPSETTDAAGTQATLLVRLEKRAKGKTVTCIYHLNEGRDDFLKQLKARLGTGGTVQDATLELRGDFREKVGNFFREKGYKVRLGN